MRRLLLILILLIPLAGKTQSKPELTRLLFIFDMSNSMNGKWQSKSKIAVAREILMQAVDSLRNVENLELALRMYGHQYKIIAGRPETQRCDDSKLEVPFSKNSHDDIRNKIRTTIPKGTTPIALSLDACAADFTDKNANNVVILITDGIEACDGVPCASARKLKAKGINVTPFVVGLGMDLKWLEQFHCIGTVFDASDEADFKIALSTVISQAMNNTSAQVNLNDINGKPLETNVAFSLYDQKGRLKYNYQHTLNYKGNPDTLIIDPVSTYRLVVHTIPEVTKDNIKLKPGEHNIIEVDAPQGHLEMKMRGVTDRGHIASILRTKDKMQTIYVPYFGEDEPVIVGTYDIEVLTLPRMYFNDVKINQSKTTTIEVPQPGQLKYESYHMNYGAIYTVSGKKQEWIYNIDPKMSNHWLELLPGEYKIVYRKNSSQKTIQTRTENFRIHSGQITNIKLE